jgi:hypothetical protein
MSGAFQLIGGAADKIRQKLTTTAATVVAGSATLQTAVVWFQCTEMAGGTPNLTIEVYDAATTTSYYLRNAKAMTAREGIPFEAGIVLNPNEFLRITASVANQVDVVGLSLLNNSLS